MVGVTGAGGYVGSRILARLRAEGIDAVALVRRPAAEKAGARGGAVRRYALGEPPERSLLDGIETVVHAAYDLSARGKQVREVNYAGALPLLEALAERGGRVILISSLAAFAGARSDYGQAKLELERAVLTRGGVALRPGIVFGVSAGGMFGALALTLSQRSLTPLIGGGWQRLFVTHDERLCELVAAIVKGRFNPEQPVFAAHEVPTSLRVIAEQITAANGHRLHAFALPTLPTYAALRCAEGVGVSLSFRSDSVRSLANPIPLDQVAALARGPVEFPALGPELWRG
jgi:nucleoside-diphosphate-sugar epimerase